MWFGCSTNMGVHWTAILLVLLSIGSLDYGHACDSDCQDALLEKFKSLLNDQLRSELGKVNNKIAQINGEMKIIKNKVIDIHVDVPAVSGRSEASLKGTKEVKKIQEAMFTELRYVKDKIDSFEDRLGYLNSGIGELKNDVQIINKDISNL